MKYNISQKALEAQLMLVFVNAKFVTSNVRNLAFTTKIIMTSNAIVLFSDQTVGFHARRSLFESQTSKRRLRKPKAFAQVNSKSKLEKLITRTPFNIKGIFYDKRCGLRAKTRINEEHIMMTCHPHDKAIIICCTAKWSYTAAFFMNNDRRAYKKLVEM